MQKLMAYMRVSNELARRHQELLTKQAAVQASLEPLIDAAVESCVKHGRLLLEEKVAFAPTLRDHKTCLEVIRDLAAHRNTEEMATIGVPIPGVTKTASSRRAVGAPIADMDQTAGGRRFREIVESGGAAF